MNFSFALRLYRRPTYHVGDFIMPIQTTDPEISNGQVDCEQYL